MLAVITNLTFQEFTCQYIDVAIKMTNWLGIAR